MTNDEVRGALLEMVRVRARHCSRLLIMDTRMSTLRADPIGAWFLSMGAMEAFTGKMAPDTYAHDLAARLAAQVCARLPQGARTLVAIEEAAGLPRLRAD